MRPNCVQKKVNISFPEAAKPNEKQFSAILTQHWTTRSSLKNSETASSSMIILSNLFTLSLQLMDRLTTSQFRQHPHFLLHLPFRFHLQWKERSWLPCFSRELSWFQTLSSSSVWVSQGEIVNIRHMAFAMVGDNLSQTPASSPRNDSSFNVRFYVASAWLV